MVTGELKSQINKVWNAFWTGGTQRGAVPTNLLYQYAPIGPDGPFTDAQVTTLLQALDHVAATVEAS